MFGLAVWPLLMIFLRISQSKEGGKVRQLAMALGYCCLAVLPYSLTGQDWVESSLMSFGGFSTSQAKIFAMLYVIELGLFLWLAIAVPFLLFPGFNLFQLLFGCCSFLLVDYFFPRMIPWNYGELALTDIPVLENAASLVGAWGLGVLIYLWSFSLACAIQSIQDFKHKTILLLSSAVSVMTTVTFLGYSIYWQLVKEAAGSGRSKFKLLLSNPILFFLKKIADSNGRTFYT